MCLFQFDCTNTLNDQILQDVTVQMESGDNFEVVRYVPAAQLTCDVTTPTYTLVRMPEDPLTGTSDPFNCYPYALNSSIFIAPHCLVWGFSFFIFSTT